MMNETEPTKAGHTLRRQADDSAREMLLLDSLNMMKDTYYRISCIDLDRNSMQPIVIPDNEKDAAADYQLDYRKSIQKITDEYVLPEYRTKFLNILMPERMRKLMTGNVHYIDISYRRLESGVPHWVRSELMAMPGYGKEHHRVMWYVKNIAYEKAMEERLSQQLIKTNTDINLRLESILSGILGGFKISLADRTFTFEYVSPAIAAIQGYTVEEFMSVSGGTALGNLYPEDVEKTLDTLYTQLARSDTYLVKYRVLHKDKSIKWIQDSGKRIVGEDGQIRYYSLLQDITQQEEQYIALQNALTMQAQMVSSLTSGIFAYTLPEHKTLILNQEARRMFDCSPSDDTPASDFNFPAQMNSRLLPADSAVFRRVKEQLQKPGDQIEYVFRVQKEDGNLLTIQANSKLLQFEDGQHFVLSALVDMTEHFHMDELLREERTQYRDVLTEGSELAFSFDLTEGIITESDATPSLVQELRRLGLTFPIHYDDFFSAWADTKNLRLSKQDSIVELDQQALLEQYKKGNARMDIRCHAFKTEQHYQILLLLSEFPNNGHIRAILIIYDKTDAVKEAMEKKAAEKKKEQDAKKALEDAYEAAKRANSAKTDFLANMSHDIRTPMNAIIGLTAIAGTHLDDRERVADCLDKITVSSKHLLGLINEVLDMSKIESGKLDLQMEEFNLPDLIDGLLTMTKPQIAAKQQELTVNIHEIEHEKVIGDRQRIQQSFTNLMSNATKYTPEHGKIQLSLTEKPTNRPKVGCYEFIFEDNGIGMSQEFLQHLFEPFERARDNRVEKIQGTGLGMAITKNIVQMMNGDIQVESELNKGTRFTVTIFLKLQDMDDMPSYDSFIHLPVLVADADKDSCESACTILKELGMSPQWALTGREAVHLTMQRHREENDFFAVMIDLKMPDMDGIQIAREIRRLSESDVPIIILSAYDWSDIELEARSAGVNAFIPKPLFKSKVIHLFCELLGTDHEERKASPLDEIAAQNFRGRRALLAEDNAINAEIAQEILSLAGLTIVHAPNGKAAFDLISEAAPDEYDIIFMDIQMPIMNGYEATRAIRALPGDYAKRVPIIAMTANAFAEDVTAAKAAGMNEHIAKPLDFDQLSKVLKKWLT